MDSKKNNKIILDKAMAKEINPIGWIVYLLVVLALIVFYALILIFNLGNLWSNIYKIFVIILIFIAGFMEYDYSAKEIEIKKCIANEQSEKGLRETYKMDSEQVWLLILKPIALIATVASSCLGLFQ
ncbi:hypothetical protein OZX73_05280 [Bifidobacterium sp. ESL0775]|uniref:hypothetical protein n=1 Tax=Bifidobacterium sp. ESL0775 TaxID=2983230 RepID=UPI0023F6FD63|nr:hypothetical protein [Bifidobacterium sp. ESL0775]WEV68704.1 hypothetical protein OZX73_05280 [Bifidobacterium sp. ESL0775]